MSPEVKLLLDDLKVHPREFFSDVIGLVAGRAYDPEPLSDDMIAGLEAALADIKTAFT